MGFFDRFKKKKTEETIHDEINNEDVEIEEDQLALKEIAINHKNRHVRAKATSDIKNQFVLLEIAKTVKDRAIRLLAISKIDDQALLKDAAEYADFYDVRSFAYERLGENNKSIALIVINQKKSSKGYKIFNKIDDNKTLADIAIEAVDKKYRKEALKKIDDSKILADLAINAKDRQIRVEALKKSEDIDVEVLQDILQEDKDEKAGVTIKNVGKSELHILSLGKVEILGNIKLPVSVKPGDDFIFKIKTSDARVMIITNDVKRPRQSIRIKK